MTNNTNKKELIAIYTDSGAYVEEEIVDTGKAFNDDKLFRDFDENFYLTLLHFGFNVYDAEMSPSLAYLYEFSTKFIEILSKSPDIEFTRTYPIISQDIRDELLSDIPFAIGSENITDHWIESIWKNTGEAFTKEFAGFDGSFSDYLLYHNSGLNIFGKIYLHLVERKDDEFPFAFMATYTRKAAGTSKAEHLPLKNALNEYKNDKDELIKLLSTIEKAAKQSLFIGSLLDSGELFSPLKFTSEEAYTFLKEIPLYEDAGIVCRMPNWWKKKTNRVELKLSIGDTGQNLLGLDTLLNIDPSLDIGGEILSYEETQTLLDMTEGLVMLKGKWVAVDHSKLKQVIDAFETVKQMGDITVGESLRLQMGLDDINSSIPEEVKVTNGEWFKSIMTQLRMPTGKNIYKLPKSFRAELREYQTTGFNWLNTMHELKFGALLADDMGLGKTVQILALLDYLKEKTDEKTLLIIPVSLIGNWSNEISRFAPELKFSIIHNKYNGSIEDASSLFITTYSMIRKIENLSKTNWDILILDEAQAIKNSTTKQTRAIKQIPSKFRIALTGTPIENNLGDLWSIFDFLNPGLLGSVNEFRKFLNTGDSQKVYPRIKKTIEPFILRRLKTDNTIIKDLPPKIEIKAYSTLTAKQKVLYKKTVQELGEAVTSYDGIEQKGKVMAALIKFKQICNHPSHYLGQQAYNPKDSGKFEKLKEICEVIRDKHEKVLVFTQYKEIVGPLSEYLAGIFGNPGLVMHGSVPAAKRGGIIDEFNKNVHVPYMVLSLKAGGVGLNLTAANHVVHFDRWWNPAVENQATDRAFRIGQTRKVVVHKFVTEKTLEEKIDKMIEEKQKLADDIIGAVGEKWITELDEDQLMDLVRLN